MRKIPQRAPADVEAMIKVTTARVTQLRTVEEWYAEIARLYKLSVDHGLELHVRGSQIIAIPGPDGVNVGHIGGPFAKFHADLNKPDACLRAEFDQFLDIARELVPAPVVKPGKAAHNGEFVARNFDSWKNLMIVEFAEALAWRAGLPEAERDLISDAALGRWIKRNSSKNVNVTKKALTDALACLPALGSQTSHEMTRDESVRRDIKDGIAEDIKRSWRFP